MQSTVDVAQLWDTKEFADLRVAVEPGGVVYDVHRVVVLPQCQYLRDAEKEYTAPMMCTVTLSAGYMPTGTLSLVLEFCYVGDAVVQRVREEGAVRLLFLYQAATLLGISALSDAVFHAFGSAYADLLMEFNRAQPSTAARRDLRCVLEKITSTTWALPMYDKTVDITAQVAVNTGLWHQPVFQVFTNDIGFFPFGGDLVSRMSAEDDRNMPLAIWSAPVF